MFVSSYHGKLFLWKFFSKIFQFDANLNFKFDKVVHFIISNSEYGIFVSDLGNGWSDSSRNRVGKFINTNSLLFTAFCVGNLSNTNDDQFKHPNPTREILFSHFNQNKDNSNLKKKTLLTCFKTRQFFYSNYKNIPFRWIFYDDFFTSPGSLNHLNGIVNYKTLHITAKLSFNCT